METAVRQQAIQAIADGRAGARDRFGKPIGPGSLVIMLQPDAGTVWTVEDAKPMLDPRAPVGAIELALTCRLQVRGIAGQGLNGLAVVGQLEPVKPESPALVREQQDQLTVREFDQHGAPITDLKPIEADRGEVSPASKPLVTEH